MHTVDSNVIDNFVAETQVTSAVNSKGTKKWVVRTHIVTGTIEHVVTFHAKGRTETPYTGYDCYDAMTTYNNIDI